MSTKPTAAMRHWFVALACLPLAHGLSTSATAAIHRPVAARSPQRASTLMQAASRRLALQLAAAAAVAAPRQPAEAWCGEKFPSWAYYIKWDEAAIPFEWDGRKGEVGCRVVGDKLREKNTGVPPVLLVGTPGLGYDYLENLEALTVSDRRVIEVTFAGTRGDAPASMRSVGACAAQLEAVCRTLQLPAVHVLAHGLGAPAALQLLGDGSAPARVPMRSLTLVSPYGSLDDLRPAARPPQGATSFALPTTDPKAPQSCIADATSATAPKPWLEALAGRDALGGDALVRLLQPAVPLKVATLLAWGGPGAPRRPAAP